MSHQDKYYHGFATGRIVKENKKALNVADLLERATNDFGELRVARRFPQLTLNAGLPLSQRRDYTANSQNGGGVELVDGEYRVFATPSVASVGSLITRQRANYLSGGVLEGGIGFRATKVPSGTGKINWGFIEYDRSTAVQFSSQADGVHLQVVTDGVLELDILQEDWNIDSLDGEGASGVNLDLSIGYVSHIPIIYYGYGDIRFQIMGVTEGRKKMIDIHRESRDGQISIDRANLPLGVEVFSDSEALDVFVGGRQINSSFDDTVRPRITSGRRLAQSIGTTFIPLVSFKHKVGYEEIFSTLDSVEIDSDVDLIVEIRRNGTLSGAPAGEEFDYVGNYTESERALQYDVKATSITGGETIYDFFNTVDGKGNATNLRAKEVPNKYISEFDTTSIVARTMSGTGVVNTILRNQEKW